MRYTDGLAGYYEVLDSQQELFPAEIALARTRLNELTSVVQLYRALGGGWRAEEATHPEEYPLRRDALDALVPCEGRKSASLSLLPFLSVWALAARRRRAAWASVSATRATAFRIEAMNHLLEEIRHNPLLWLLAFVPVRVRRADGRNPSAHTVLFVLSVLAIVPLAALLSHATESVAAKTGDAVGGLLNATLGKSDGVDDRAHGTACRAVHAGEGLHRRRDRDQHALHVGCVVPARRTQVPRAGVQRRGRAAAGRAVVSGDDCVADPVGREPRGLSRDRRLHANVEPVPGVLAPRDVRPGPALLAGNASRVLRQRGPWRGRRSAAVAAWSRADDTRRGHRARRRWSAKSSSSRSRKRR